MVIPYGPPGEDARAKYLRHATNALITAAVCVSDSSSTTYCTGVRALFTWSQLCDVDPYFVIVPEGFSLTSQLTDHKTMSFISFIGYLAYDLQLNPQTVNGYKNAVINYLRSQYKDYGFTHGALVSQCMATLYRTWRKTHPVANSLRLPFTLQMYLLMKANVLNMSKPLDHAIMVGLALGLVLLLRRSELVPTPDEHFLRENDVTFLMRATTQGEPNFFCPAAQAYLHSKTQLIGVNILVRSAKNDQGGEGAKYHFETCVLSPTAVFCIA